MQDKSQKAQGKTQNAADQVADVGSDGRCFFHGLKVSAAREAKARAKAHP